MPEPNRGQETVVQEPSIKRASLVILRGEPAVVCVISTSLPDAIEVVMHGIFFRRRKRAPGGRRLASRRTVWTSHCLPGGRGGFGNLGIQIYGIGGFVFPAFSGGSRIAILLQNYDISSHLPDRIG